LRGIKGFSPLERAWVDQTQHSGGSNIWEVK